MRYIRQLIFPLGLVFVLSACGTKGPLVLPPEPTALPTSKTLNFSHSANANTSTEQH